MIVDWFHLECIEGIPSGENLVAVLDRVAGRSSPSSTSPLGARPKA